MVVLMVLVVLEMDQEVKEQIERAELAEQALGRLQGSMFSIRYLVRELAGELM